MMRARYLILAFASFGVPVASIGQESVTIPLQGVLPVRCSAQAIIKEVRGKPVPTVLITVNHICNARNNLIVSFTPVPSSSLPIQATYGGQSPSAQTAQQIAFFNSGPVNFRRELQMSLPNGTPADAKAIEQSLRISVEPL